MDPLHDALNPKFLFFSPVGSDTLDSRGLAEHIDRAIIALDGRAPLAGDCVAELMNAVLGPTTLRIDLWVESLDRWSCTYGFTVSNEEGTCAFARGERTVINIDPRSHQPAPWSPAFVASHAELQKDLPALA
ncbi:MAG TPA: hypothetical protein VF618_13250 [Thermoanaerobaculia bacterium]